MLYAWLVSPVRLHFLHLNSLLYEKQSEFFSAEDEIVFGPLFPLNKTMILHFISDIFSQCIIGISVCKTYCKPSASRTYKSQMFAGKLWVIITLGPEWEMSLVIVPRGLRFWAVCLGSCYPGPWGRDCDTRAGVYSKYPNEPQGGDHQWVRLNSICISGRGWVSV